MTPLSKRNRYTINRALSWSLGRAGYAGEGFGVVEIKHAAFFVGLELMKFSAMCPDDGAGAYIQRRRLQLRKELCGENDRVAAAAFEERQDDWRLGGIKRG